MNKIVDSNHFLEPLLRRMVKNWISLEQPRPIPWTPLSKPLSECTVALLSSGGIALKTDLPFDQEGERQNPWWGDPSFRKLPHSATAADIKVYHLHINPAFAEEDLNCLLPIERLNELAACGEIGRAAPTHYSIMGYLLDPREMLEKSVPAIVQQLKEERVDILLLVPA